jgi:hypothetical protein
MEIAMGTFALVTQRQQYPKQCYRIGTATESNQNLVLQGKQGFFLDKFLYIMFKHDTNIVLLFERTDKRHYLKPI